MICAACDHPAEDHHPYGGRCHTDVMLHVGAVQCHCEWFWAEGDE